MNVGIRSFAVLVAAVLALAIVPAAFAQSSSQGQGYNNVAGQVQQDVGGTSPAGESNGTSPAGESNGVSPAGASGSDTGGNGANGATARTSASGGGNSGLPFTGLDIALMAAVALALLGLGFGLNRLARAPEAA